MLVGIFRGNHAGRAILALKLQRSCAVWSVATTGPTLRSAQQRRPAARIRRFFGPLVPCGVTCAPYARMLSHDLEGHALSWPSAHCWRTRQSASLHLVAAIGCFGTRGRNGQRARGPPSAAKMCRKGSNRCARIAGRLPTICQEELTMRRVLTVVTVGALCYGLVSIAVGQDANGPSKAGSPAAGGLRAQGQPAVADSPATQVRQRATQQIRLQQGSGGQQGQAPGVGANRPAAWYCPWGGPGLGLGRGPAWSGAGKGPGVGRGAGLGPGWGRGACGTGRGLGPGGGQGLAPGGPFFVDKDNDGVCDYYQMRHGRNR